MFSKTTAAKEEDTNTQNNSGESENEKYLSNPIQFSALAEGCSEYEVTAKSFMSTCNQNMEDQVLDAARNLISDATGCQNPLLEASSEPPAPNPANEEQWHHRYSISFQVLAKSDPKEYLDDFFAKNILQLEDAAVRIAYFETTLVRD